jgi:protocatechuate 3,4-dioxygenase, alpha subunit
MTTLMLTSSQTVGPFFHDCLLRADSPCALCAPSEGTAGEHIRIEGRVIDGDGAAVPDAVLEIWQPDAGGRFDGDSYVGFGRFGTDANGAFAFETVKPGRVPFDANREQAPHISVAVFGRGLMNHLLTRIYFAEERANDVDPILSRVPEERRSTLIASRVGQGALVYRFDVVLQGANETVFFDFK